MAESHGDGWMEYQRLVLADLERHGRKLADIEKELHEGMSLIQTEIALLKVKAGVWGALSGLVPLILAALIYLLSRFIGSGGK